MDASLGAVPFPAPQDKFNRGTNHLLLLGKMPPEEEAVPDLKPVMAMAAEFARAYEQV